MRVRAGAVVFGGPIVLDPAALGAVASTVRALRHRRRPCPSAVAGVAATAAYLAAARPWMRGWGATSAEQRAQLPGDDLVPDADIQVTRAVSIDAPPERVWPWLAQIGQDRGGF